MKIRVDFECASHNFESLKNTGRHRPASSLVLAGMVIALLFCQGCLVLPVRAPTRTNGISGAIQKIDLDFIETGKTTRDEVTAKLGGADTGIKDKQLFLGRWASSKWGVLWVIAGNNTADGGFNRNWTRHNVLIIFDDNGVVQAVRQFPDEGLVKQLSDCAAHGQGEPLDLSAPIEVPVQHRHTSGRNFDGTFILGIDSFAFRDESRNAKNSFRISPKQIKELRLASIPEGDGSDPQYMTETIEFTEKIKVGRKMTVHVDVPTVFILVKYVTQTRSNRQPRIRTVKSQLEDSK